MQVDRNNAGQYIEAYIKRVEQVEVEIKDLNMTKSEIFKEAKHHGFDVKVLKLVLKRRRMDPDALAEQEALLQMYENAVNGIAIDPLDS